MEWKSRDWHWKVESHGVPRNSFYQEFETNRSFPGNFCPLAPLEHLECKKYKIQKKELRSYRHFDLWGLFDRK
jgi:hypothetical protein